MSDAPISQSSPAYTNQHAEDIVARLRLVNRLNLLVGDPDAAIRKLQRDFITGSMTVGDMEEFIRMYEYLIKAIEHAPSPSSGAAYTPD